MKINKKIGSILLITSALTLSGCFLTSENIENNQQMSVNKTMQKNQYLLSQGMDLNKKGKYDESYKIFYDLSTKGMPEAQSLVGKAYHLGLGVEKNAKQAEYWYKLSSSQGYSISTYLLATLYKENNDIEGYEIYIKKAIMMDLNIATEMFALDLFLNKDKLELIEWHERTKNLNNNYIFSDYLLDLLENENKIKNNTKELLIWLKSLSDNGDTSAQYKYGKAYLKGKYGLNVSLEKAIYWLKKAAVGKNISAQKDLGIIYYREKDYINSYMWFLLYSEVNTVEALKLRTLSLSKLTQYEITVANKNLNELIQKEINKIKENN